MFYKIFFSFIFKIIILVNLHSFTLAVYASSNELSKDNSNNSLSFIQRIKNFFLGEKSNSQVNESLKLKEEQASEEDNNSLSQESFIDLGDYDLEIMSHSDQTITKHNISSDSDLEIMSHSDQTITKHNISSDSDLETISHSDQTITKHNISSDSDQYLKEEQEHIHPNTLEQPFVGEVIESYIDKKEDFLLLNPDYTNSQISFVDNISDNSHDKIVAQTYIDQNHEKNLDLDIIDQKEKDQEEKNNDEDLSDLNFSRDKFIEKEFIFLNQEDDAVLFRKFINEIELEDIDIREYAIVIKNEVKNYQRRTRNALVKNFQNYIEKYKNFAYIGVKKQEVILLAAKAIKQDKIDDLRIILKYFSVNLQDQHGNSLLHIATQNGNYRIVKLLIAYGSNPNIKNICGETALKIAQDKKMSDIERLLSNINRYHISYRIK